MKKHNKKKKKSLKNILSGFTLVELLAVIVILAIIMIISIPAVLNTVSTAKQKTFAEYVTKICDTAQKKYLSEGLLNPQPAYVRYDITKDLDLGSTGDYKGHVAILNTGDKTDIYVELSTKEYHTATKVGDDSNSVLSYINYSVGGEPKFADTLGLFDGTNSFVRGEVTDFELPETGNPATLTKIDKGLTQEDVFTNGFDLLASKGYEKFMSDYRSGAPNVMKITRNEDGTINTFYTSYKLRDINPNTNDNNEGFISFTLDEHEHHSFTGKTYGMNMVIAYKDSNYRTAAYVISDQVNNGTEHPVYVPVIVFYEVNTTPDFKFDTTLTLTNNLSATDYESIASRIINENNSINPASTPEAFSKIYTEAYAYALKDQRHYVTKDFVSTIEENDYKLDVFMSKYVGM